jgi:hypothetical protein
MDQEDIAYLAGVFFFAVVAVAINIAAVSAIVWVSSMIIKSVFW